jgi:hypothetical protein
MINFTPAEKIEIKAAFRLGHTSWSKYEGINRRFPALKRKIKLHALTKSDERCCYCSREFHGEFGYVIDIEHILPKSKAQFLRYMFTPRNLGVSCKRCNMRLKGKKIDFLSVNISQLRNQPFKSKYYKFIHPNLDKFDNHLKLLNLREGRERFIKYIVLNSSLKGNFNYHYFKLQELELDNFERIQGGNGKSEPKNPMVRAFFERHEL